MTTCRRIGYLLLLALAGQNGCAAQSSPHGGASPFEAGTTLFTAVLDAITAREVVGVVKIVPTPVEPPVKGQLPLPVHWSPTRQSELDSRRGTIVALGFAVDSIAELGDCPGFWSTAEMRTGCPASPQTTIAVSHSYELSAPDRAIVKKRYSRGAEPDSAVTLLFVVRTPAGAAMVVSEYYLRRDSQGFWVVVGKRVLLQTE